MKYLIIIISVFLIACSDPSEDIKTIIELNPTLNNGTWLGGRSTYSFKVDSLTVTDITFHPDLLGQSNESTYQFRDDSLHIKVRLRDIKTGSLVSMEWVMRWDIGSDEAKGYTTLTNEEGNPWYLTKNEIIFTKQKQDE